MIKLNSISKVYRTTDIETVALNDVNLTVKDGEFLSVMGPSGCGKTTLLNIIGLLDSPTRGNIEVNGTDVTRLDRKRLAEFRNRKLGFIFQSFHLVNTLNVMDNVELPLLYRRMNSKERSKLAQQMLERVGLQHRLRQSHYPGQLSGGQQQRVAIARALVGNPKILLADEPTGNLDSITGSEIMELIHRLNKEDGLTVIMVTHNEKQALLTDRIIKLNDGKQINEVTYKQI